MREFPWDELRQAASSIASANEAKFAHVQRFVARVSKSGWALARQSDIDQLFCTRLLGQLLPFSQLRPISLAQLEERPEWSEESKTDYTNRLIGRVKRTFDMSLMDIGRTVSDWARCESAVEKVGAQITDFVSDRYDDQYPKLHDLVFTTSMGEFSGICIMGMLIQLAIANALLFALGETVIRPDELFRLMTNYIPIGVTQEGVGIILVQ